MIWCTRRGRNMCVQCASIDVQKSREWSIILKPSMLQPLDISVVYARKNARLKMLLWFINLGFTGDDCILFYCSKPKYICLGLNSLLSSKIERDLDNGQWFCLECGYTSSTRQRVMFHVEAKHVTGPGHVCEICDKFLPTKNALNLHRSRKHRPTEMVYS